MTNKKNVPNAPGKWRIMWSSAPDKLPQTYTVNVFKERGVLMFFVPGVNKYAAPCSSFNTWLGLEVSP